jgi:hypothetical protein
MQSFGYEEGTFMGGYIYGRVHLWEGTFMGGYIYGRVHLWEGTFMGDDVVGQTPRDLAKLEIVK